ncbi:MAG: copper homeostasis protein CutC [Gemmiger sp.]
MTSTPLLEVCVDSYASAMAAIRGGADRLELCSALDIGGLTPWAALLVQIRRESDIPIRCLIRPRPGDFCYTDDEIDLLCAQIISLHRNGASGFVIGALNRDGTLNELAMRRLIGATGGAPTTLHRCIDVSFDPVETYDTAAALGVDTVLTSGCAAKCVDGMNVLGRLLTRRGITAGPEVMIGAGVNAGVIRTVRSRYPKAKVFHMSGKTAQPSPMRFRREGVPMGAPGFDEWTNWVTDESAVRAAKAALTE